MEEEEIEKMEEKKERRAERRSDDLKRRASHQRGSSTAPLPKKRFLSKDSDSLIIAVAKWLSRSLYPHSDRQRAELHCISFLGYTVDQLTNELAN